jgi:CheY-like chemotaxis protein
MSNLKRILMIDDNTTDCDLLAEIFDEEFDNIHFQCSCNGDDALNYLQDLLTYPDKLPHLILLDFNLPGKNGPEILREIKEDKTICHIPVIIFSSSDRTEDINSSFCEGANAYLVKKNHYDDIVSQFAKIIEFWFEVSELPA